MTYFLSGDYNFYCQLCGKKEKASKSMLTWNGLRACRHHREVRNPQDFVRGVKDVQSVPWAVPQATDTFVQSCTLLGCNAVPTYAIPGCVWPDNENIALPPYVDTTQYLCTEAVDNLTTETGIFLALES
jgi:hypothetical protein